MRALVRQLMKIASMRGEVMKDLLQVAVEKIKSSDEPKAPEGAPPEPKSDEAPPPSPEKPGATS